MAKLKIDSLDNGDIKRFKNMADLCNTFNLEGKDKKLNKENPYKELLPLVYNDRIKMIVQDIKEVEPGIKVVTIRHDKEQKIALFKPGQYISVTFFLDNKIVTRIYTLISGIRNARFFEYSFVIEDDPEGKVGTFLYHNLNKGEDLIVSGPFGDFYYEELRDKANIIGLCSPKGVQPFISMAQAIAEGDLNVTLNIIYSAKKNSELVLLEYLRRIADSTPKVNVTVLLSDEDIIGAKKGVITCDLVRSIFDKNSSIFVSGEEGFLKYLNKELEGLKIPRKFIRYNMYKPKCNIKKVKNYTMTVNILYKHYKYPCFNNKTILESIEESGLYIPNRCHVGTCGLCKTKLLSGKVKVVNDCRSSIDISNNVICPCSTYPMSDIEIRIK